MHEPNLISHPVVPVVVERHLAPLPPPPGSPDEGEAVDEEGADAGDVVQDHHGAGEHDRSGQGLKKKFKAMLFPTN